MIHLHIELALRHRTLQNKDVLVRLSAPTPLSLPDASSPA